MGKTKYWLSILAVSVVLLAGSLAVSPIAIADDDDEDDDDDDDDGGPAPGPAVNCSALIDLLNTLMPPLTLGQANLILILVGCEPITIPPPEPACRTAADCDDSNVCNGAETCEAGECVAGGPISCDDSNQCTSDSCDSETGCGNDPISCDDGNDCTADSCDSVNGCTSDPVPNGTPCGIGAGVCQLGVCLESPGPLGIFLRCVCESGGIIVFCAPELTCEFADDFCETECQVSGNGFSLVASCTPNSCSLAP